MLIADTLPDPNSYTSIGWLLVGLAAIIAIINSGLNLTDRFTGAKKKREVSFEFTPASKEEFDIHKAANAKDHDNLFSKIGGVDRGATMKIGSEVTAIHNRINAIEKSVGALEATTTLQNSHLATMDAKLDNMPDRVIATLKNTRAI